jgi:iron complex outermembrane receptor protein
VPRSGAPMRSTVSSTSLPKSAKDTQGLYLTAGLGNELTAFGAMRYGGEIDKDTHFRIWTKYVDHNSFTTPGGVDRPDDFATMRDGFRMDADGGDDLHTTVIAEIHTTNRLGQGNMRPSPAGHLATTTYAEDGAFRNGFFLGRISQGDPAAPHWQLQAYYDRRARDEVSTLDFDRDTFNIDMRFNHKVDLHEFHFGVAYDETRDDVTSLPTLNFTPSSRTRRTTSAFVQDTITLEEDRWFLMIGSKFEDNDTTGFEYQPNIRLWHTPDDRNTFWVSWSRPVRTPSRSNEDVFLINAYVDTGLLAGGAASGTIIPLILTGNPDVQAEKLQAYELGYRSIIQDN